MRLRIVSGRLRGRFIDAPPGRATRPTSERVREAWFSALGDTVVDAAVFDLFAGSGALGIEALSRGARHVHFVESDARTAAALRRTLEGLEIGDSATVVKADVFRWLATIPQAGDVALADPPYAGDDAAKLVEAYRATPFADCLWVEHESRRPDVLDAGPSWTRRYGDSSVSRFCEADLSNLLDGVEST